MRHALIGLFVGLGGFIVAAAVLAALAVAWTKPTSFRAPHVPRALAVMLTIALLALAAVHVFRGTGSIGSAC